MFHPLWALPIVLLLAIGSSATAEAAPLRECGDLRVSFGVSIIDVTNITTRGVRCSRARRFSRAFAKQGATFACQEGPYCFFRGYRCRLRGRMDDYRCVAGSRVVRWQMNA